MDNQANIVHRYTMSEDLEKIRENFEKIAISRQLEIGDKFPYKIRMFENYVRPRFKIYFRSSFDNALLRFFKSRI